MSGQRGLEGRTVGIIGAGQIGTAIGMALRASRRMNGVGHVAVFDRNPDAVAASLERGSADSAASLEDAAACDVVVLAVPVPEVEVLVQQLGRSLRAGVLLVDTGSAKTVVVDAMRRSVPASVHAIGGHPMAGTAIPGPSGAAPEGLRGATFALCPVRPDESAVDLARAFAESIGCIPLVVDASAHDRAVALTSHAPHMVAAAVALAAGRALEEVPVTALSAGGFAGATRLSASDPAMVAGFLRANADETLVALKEIRAELDAVEEALAEGPGAIEAVLETAGRARRAVMGEPPP